MVEARDQQQRPRRRWQRQWRHLLRFSLALHHWTCSCHPSPQMRSASLQAASLPLHLQLLLPLPLRCHPVRFLL
jgi:hypothetical protein